MFILSNNDKKGDDEKENNNLFDEDDNSDSSEPSSPQLSSFKEEQNDNKPASLENNESRIFENFNNNKKASLISNNNNPKEEENKEINMQMQRVEKGKNKKSVLNRNETNKFSKEKLLKSTTEFDNLFRETINMKRREILKDSTFDQNDMNLFDFEFEKTRIIWITTNGGIWEIAWRNLKFICEVEKKK